MCQCGCGDSNLSELYKVGRDKYIAVGNYQGCSYCGTGLVFDVQFLTSKGVREWARYLKAKPIRFSEFGGDSMMLGTVGKEELQKGAARLIKEKRMGKSFKDFRSVEDWLEEHGLELLQEAFRVHLEEIRDAKNPRVEVLLTEAQK